MKNTTNPLLQETKFISLLKNIFSDIWLVLRNFFHWTFARLIIIILCFLLATLSFLPFFIVLVILWIIDSIAWGNIFLSFVEGTNEPLLVAAFFTSPFMMIFEWIIMLIWVAFSLGVYNYKKVLLYRLIDSYCRKQKLPFKEVFTLHFLKAYMKLFPVLLLIFLAPLLWFVVYFAFIIFIFGWFASVVSIVDSSTINLVSIFLAFWFVITFLYAIYLYYKFIFVYPLLLKHDQKSFAARALLQKSYNLLQGKTLLHLFLIIVLYIAITQPLWLFSNYAEDSARDIRLHLYYKELSTLPENFDFSGISTEYTTKDDFINSVEYVGLENIYGKYSVDQLSSKIIKLELSYRVTALISFFLLYGMYEVVVMSFARRKLTLYNDIIKKENRVRKLVNAILHPIAHQQNKSVEEL